MEPPGKPKIMGKSMLKRGAQKGGQRVKTSGSMCIGVGRRSPNAVCHFPRKLKISLKMSPLWVPISFHFGYLFRGFLQQVAQGLQGPAPKWEKIRKWTPRVPKCSPRVPKWSPKVTQIKNKNPKAGLKCNQDTEMSNLEPPSPPTWPSNWCSRRHGNAK